MLYDAKNPHGGDTYGGGIRVDLSANVNPLGTPPAVLEAAKASLSLADRYPDPFCRDLAAAISAHDGVPMEYVLCGNGAAELIYAWCAALRPETALETAPAYAMVYLYQDLSGQVSILSIADFDIGSLCAY